MVQSRLMACRSFSKKPFATFSGFPVAPDLLQMRLLLRVQVLRDHDLDHDVLVAAAASPNMGDPLAGEPEGLTVLSPRGYRDLNRPVNGWHLDVVTERRLDHVDFQLVDHVLVTAGQVRMGLHPDDYVEVARRSTADSGLALARQPDLR